MRYSGCGCVTLCLEGTCRGTLENVRGQVSGVSSLFTMQILGTERRSSGLVIPTKSSHQLYTLNFICAFKKAISAEKNSSSLIKYVVNPFLKSFRSSLKGPMQPSHAHIFTVLPRAIG